tara:strand:- start:9175 stop:9399 length:225 start_codon:yes stop_codon:yes gene_type:complete
MPFVLGHGVTLTAGTTDNANTKTSSSTPARIVAAAHGHMSKFLAAATHKQPQPTTHPQTTPAATPTISNHGLVF